jgi:hypothetical protein
MNRAARRAMRLQQQQQKPKPNATVWAKVLQGSTVIAPDLADAVMLRAHAAFDELRNARAKEELTAHSLMHILADTINTAMVRAEAINPAIESMLNLAVEAMQRADDRQATCGHYGFDGPGLQAIREALDIYEEILRHSSEKQMIDAEAEGRRRAMRQFREQQQREEKLPPA